jgi:hypothetical protein
VVSSSSRAPLIVFGAAFLLVGGIFIYIGGSNLLEQRRYRQQGVQVEAVATGKALRRATTTTDTAYEISYQFNLPGGSPYQQTESVSVPLWERVEQGSPLTVEYVPGALASARVVVGNDSDERTSAIGALAVGVVLVLLAPISWFVLLDRGRSRRVADGGVSAPRRDATPELTEPVGEASTVGVSHQPSFWPLARKSPGLWFGGFSLLFGLPWLVLNGIVPLHDEWRFAQEGRSTQGMVLTKEIRRSGSTRSETLHYEATYRFAVAGETIEGRDELSLEDWKRLVEREPADVLYRAQEPSSSRLAGHRPWLLKTLFGLIGLVLTVLGSTLLVRAVRSTRLGLRLRQHGVSAQGTVTELRARNLRVNRVQLWRLQYEYRDFEGRLHVKTFDLPQDEAHTWKVGDVGGVLFDPVRPTEAVWLGRAGSH